MEVDFSQVIRQWSELLNEQKLELEQDLQQMYEEMEKNNLPISELESYHRLGYDEDKDLAQNYLYVKSEQKDGVIEVNQIFFHSKKSYNEINEL